VEAQEVVPIHSSAAAPVCAAGFISATRRMETLARIVYRAAQQGQARQFLSIGDHATDEEGRA
jgi:hypothetical protein